MSKKNKYPKGDINFRESVFDKHEAFELWFNKLYRLAIASIKIEGLPDEILQFDVLRQLIDNGKCVFYYDPDAEKYFCLPFVNNGLYNVYERPTSYRAIGYGGFQFDNLNESNSVIIWADYKDYPILRNIFKYAERLAEIELTMLLNVDKQKMPYFISCPDNQRLTFINLMKSVTGNERVIYGNKDIDLNNVQVVRTDAPFMADKLYQLLINCYNEFLTYLGISNVSFEKRERVNSEEVSRMMGGTFINRQARLLPLNECAERINKMYGLNIQFYFNEVEDVDFDDNQNGDYEEDTDNE